ncbi:unnamed protein product [Ilex paraguariensis]|uniref:Cellulose synthase-like protein G2 n=1 Tax=Ilex paraguariensis TaxID=185542 RepID=A0ABC8T7Q6_9AQUA
MDGLKGPMMSGTGFYIKREALYGTYMQKDKDPFQLKQSFGPSNEFIKWLNTGCKNNGIDREDLLDTRLREAKFLASCTYEKDSQWGQQASKSRGWTSIYCDPQRPAFLGSATTNLNDMLVQGTRWNSGLLDVCLSRFCPIVYGLSRMSILETMCYAYLSFQPFYCLPVWCLGTIPQLCLLNGIPIYPKVSSPWFVMFSLVFISLLVKYLWDVLYSGGTIQTWWREWRVWMIKSVTAYSYGSLYTVLKLLGLKEASFQPTNKVADEEQFRRYQMGVFDFQTSTMLLAPLVSLLIINMASFTWGIARVIVSSGWREMFGQIFLSCFILIVNYPFIEGMILRKDSGCIPPNVILLSAVFSLIFLCLGSIVLMYTMI